VAGFFGDGDEAPQGGADAAPAPRRSRRSAGPRHSPRTVELSPERREAEQAIARHRVYVGIGVAAVVGVLLFVPTEPSAAAAHAVRHGGRATPAGPRPTGHRGPVGALVAEPGAPRSARA